MNIKMANGSSISMSDKGESVKSIFQESNDIVTKQDVDIKMADVFGEGFSLWNESGFINDGESDLGSMSCNSFTDAAVIAINSYDSNQALIAKRAEQIEYLDGYVTGIQIQNDLCTKENDRLAAENEMLREALELSIPFLPFDSVAEAKAYQALKATKE